jgi:hypothetical protein
VHSCPKGTWRSCDEVVLGSRSELAEGDSLNNM